MTTTTLGPRGALRPSVGRRERAARARAGAILVQGLAASAVAMAAGAPVSTSTAVAGLGVIGVAAAGGYLHRAYVEPYRAIRRSIRLEPRPRQ